MRPPTFLPLLLSTLTLTLSTPLPIPLADPLVIPGRGLRTGLATLGALGAGAVGALATLGAWMGAQDADDEAAPAQPRPQVQNGWGSQSQTQGQGNGGYAVVPQAQSNGWGYQPQPRQGQGQDSGYAVSQNQGQGNWGYAPSQPQPQPQEQGGYAPVPPAQQAPNSLSPNGGAYSSAPASWPNPASDSASSGTGGGVGQTRGAPSNSGNTSQRPGASSRDSTAQIAPIRPAMQVSTISAPTLCRRYPDNLSASSDQVTLYAKATQLLAACWGKSGMSPADGDKVRGSEIWIKIWRDGKIGEGGECWMDAAGIEGGDDEVKGALGYCDAPPHWVGRLQAGYTREDCYECRSLDCKSQNLGNGPYVDVRCWGGGPTVKGNATWFKSQDHECYFPGAVFDPEQWKGTNLGQCPTSSV
ncbi:hypothetical protein EJ06DRAFT_553052 [Trichodelitschia bisporula]|uniref:Uncharacterized protein n=1 Tax=Trichodelitschia bisporula TaxID=703511 RepID=A0A6G1I7V5_9PEZI|nr:hypothetical protein EJ06DRAFT_553052 [Trichodelitschia bisporula]